MHILFLTDNFFPEVNAPASRTYEHAKVWAASNHQVTIITCAPNFPKGKVFEGYQNKLWQSETIEGIRVIRVWSYIARNEGFAKRILDFLSYMVTSFIAALFVRKVDVVVGTSPQFFTVCSAWAVSVLKLSAFVFELRDIWPESIRVVSSIKDSKFLLLMEKLELFLYRRAKLIICVTNSFKDNLIERGIAADKIEVVTNGVDIENFSPKEKDAALLKELNLSGKFVIGYIGTHGLAHSLETVIDAAKQLEMQKGNEKIVFLFLGDGAEKTSLMKKSEGLSNVLFLDTVSKGEVGRYWSLLDISIIHLKKDELFKKVIPSKMFEAMAMAIPTLHGVEGESAEIQRENKTGIIFDPQNSEDLISGIQILKNDKVKIDELKLNGPIAAKKYDRKGLALKMLKLLERVQ